ncbi:hypothetical protein RHGRI_035373 [Rhododendron griersonianum]|uniref:Uncharacterized protein n=1 Tax=Rhododendron griersonianum TaxID=479676 RepID=A0AAV6I4A8_9ERIC|nr:hypothetical protein RHGRI_035373 [Rhododendron griersonianum]
MAGKHSSSITPRTRSRLLLFLLSLLFYTISFFTSPSDSLPLRSSPNSNSSADNSFVASLEKFLAQKPRALLDDAVASVSEQGVKKLDDMIWKTETERLYGDPFFPPLRVYVYEMPKKFTYDLLTLFRNTYRETSNGTSLLIYLPSVRGLRGRGEMAHGSPAISQAAQPVPFGAICCYQLVDGGLSASGLFSLFLFVSNLSDFSLERAKPSYIFGGKIRSKLGPELSGTEGVQIEEGTAGEAGKEAAQDGMRKSIFCLTPFAGFTEAVSVPSMDYYSGCYTGIYPSFASSPAGVRGAQFNVSNSVLPSVASSSSVSAQPWDYDTNEADRRSVRFYKASKHSSLALINQQLNKKTELERTQIYNLH